MEQRRFGKLQFMLPTFDKSVSHTRKREVSSISCNMCSIFERCINFFWRLCVSCIVFKISYSHTHTHIHPQWYYKRYKHVNNFVSEIRIIHLGVCRWIVIYIAYTHTYIIFTDYHTRFKSIFVCVSSRFISRVRMPLARSRSVSLCSGARVWESWQLIRLVSINHTPATTRSLFIQASGGRREVHYFRQIKGERKYFGLWVNLEIARLETASAKK